MGQERPPAETAAHLEIETREALWEWLTHRHQQRDSVWLVTFKKAVPEKHVSTGAVLDALVAYGWVDGVRRKLDAERTMQLIAPRRQQIWAQSYKDRAERLEREGRMAQPGRDAIAQAKAAGLWTRSAPIDALDIPADLAEALARDARADGFFRAAAPSYRRNVLRWIAAAKRAETRAKRVADACAASSRSEKLRHM